jgi:polyphosphate kinase
MVSSTKLKGKRKSRLKRVASPAAPLSTDEFFPRELSWLQFNQRVLFQAENNGIPLLERLRFLTITTSNLDEFFMNRIGRLKDSQDQSRPLSVNTPLEQHLKTIRTSVLDLTVRQDTLYLRTLIPSLVQNGISIVTWEELSQMESDIARSYFKAYVFPVLTPQAVDPGHPFPALSNLSLSLGVQLKLPDRSEELFARVKIPVVLPQLIHLPTRAGEHVRAISLTELVRHNLESLFPGMIVEEVLPFRVTRNAELNLDDYESDDLMESVAEGLRERKFASIVRLEHAPNPPMSILRFLIEELGLTPDDAYVSASSVDYPALRELAELPIPHLKFEPWSPVTPAQLFDEDANIFSAIRSADIMVHHPYESFSGSVERLLRAAINDPKVLSIKMTLYRAGDNSSLIPLLIKAAEVEKQVVVLIEVKASMDEARNIRLAQQLEEAGVHVMYGVLGLKTHAKAILIARSEQDGIRCYAHLGTGNYNSTTARFYTDIGLFTCNQAICDELVEVFHYLTGRSLKRDYQHILVSPVGLREGLLASIDREIENQKSGRPAHIIIKANALEDTTICRAISKAAAQKVPIDLIIRGVCCLKPTIADGVVSPRVISVVDRFLEHSRIYYFRNGAAEILDGDFWISSADPMYRNLHRRVELAIPLKDPDVRRRCWEILTTAIHDQCSAWELNPDGTYILRKSDQNRLAMPSQQLLMKLARDKARALGLE